MKKFKYRCKEDRLHKIKRSSVSLAKNFKIIVSKYKI